MGDDSPICSRARDVLDDGGDPDGSEAHALDVVELVDDALPGATTVVSEVAGCRGAAVGAGEAVGEDLVDGLATPLIGVEATGARSGENDCQECLA